MSFQFELLFAIVYNSVCKELQMQTYSRYPATKTFAVDYIKLIRHYSLYAALSPIPRPGEELLLCRHRLQLHVSLDM